MDGIDNIVMLPSPMPRCLNQGTKAAKFTEEKSKNFNSNSKILDFRKQVANLVVDTNALNAQVDDFKSRLLGRLDARGIKGVNETFTRCETTGSKKIRVVANVATNSKNVSIEARDTFEDSEFNDLGKEVETPSVVVSSASVKEETVIAPKEEAKEVIEQPSEVTETPVTNDIPDISMTRVERNAATVEAVNNEVTETENTAYSHNAIRDTSEEEAVLNKVRLASSNNDDENKFNQELAELVQDNYTKQEEIANTKAELEELKNLINEAEYAKYEGILKAKKEENLQLTMTLNDLKSQLEVARQKYTAMQADRYDVEESHQKVA